MFNTLGIDDLHSRKDVTYHGCSAVTGDGVWESIAKLADLMDLLLKSGEK